MTWQEFALWGAAGGFAVEALEFRTATAKLNAVPWGKPGQPTIPAAIASIFIRLTLGAIIATAAGMGEQVSGILGAFGAGVAAPLIIEKLGKAVSESVPRDVRNGGDPASPLATRRVAEGGAE